MKEGIHMTNSKKEDIDVKSFYGEDCILDSEEFKKKYKVSEKGLSSSKASENLKNYGLNQVRQSKPKKWYNYFYY